MNTSSTSTPPNNEISSAVSRKSSSTNSLSRFSLNLLIQYIENVLSAITSQGLGCKIIDSGTELRDLVQPVASDFSKLFEGISEGAKMFSDQKFLKSRLSAEAHSMAVDVLKGLGNAHWVAAGLLAIANVLERFDNISKMDRECIDLLKDMLKLGKYLKQMKDLNVKFHIEVLDDMREAVQLILSGAILCRSFIASNKLSKFLLTKKIRDELVYVRGKVNAMKSDLQGHMQLLIMKTVTFIQEQYISTGRNEEYSCLGITEQYQSTDTHCEMEQICKTELDGSESNTVPSQGQDNCNEINGYTQLEMPFRSSFQLGKFLRKKFPTIFRRRPKFSLHLESQLLVKEIHPSFTKFKFDELHKATKGFSQKLGEGAFSSVYYGILSNGRRVAVKILRTKSLQGERVWVNELRTLSKLCHQSIIELVGYCYEDEMMLVVDYMPQNLHKIIFGEDVMIIDWPTRHNIILDIIRVLKYLHDGCIVHRDIKPMNILLDQNLNVKICDFGIARILQPGNANMEISTDGVFCPEDIYDTSDVCGTLGYLDPEYFSTNCLTPKTDIYSFGILLLNVVSGKEAIDWKHRIFFLVKEAWGLCEEDRLTELIDPGLLNTDGLINSSSIVRTIKIALWCVIEKSEMRPSASRVLTMLSSEEEIPIPTPDQSFYEYYSEDEISSVTDSHISEEEIPIPTPDQSFYEYYSEDEISTVTDYHTSEEEIPIPTPDQSFYEYYSEDEISSVTDYHTSEQEIPDPTLPVESHFDHVVANHNSLVKKTEQSVTKWSDASPKTLKILCVLSLVIFICLFRAFTNVPHL
ncbi:uncharacterized protein LOC131856672 [Cryptomeria japonica]|uniref:uncharacterized protein LOC131856672 n=1 Tax=Cryptomeria japonica TaxID=3369 RepID=UPI0027DA8F00|nr:uncharacterized protein LOC131856672 [Cryptomeria japonica]XP_059064520.1 uncharacterized protein LOC131856672 [Cryptomeria japonica]